MSIWVDTKIDDIEVDKAEQAVNIFVDCDWLPDSTYAILTFDQIKCIYREITEGENK